MITLFPLFALVAPFMSAFIVLCTHRRISYRLVSFVTVGALVISFAFTVISWHFISSLSGLIFYDFAEVFQKYWLCSNWIQLTANFIFDELSLFLFFLVVGVSLCVHLYSIEYMHQDPERNLFFGYLSLFTFFMLILVSSGNLIQFFIGWEGIGMCSYLLINFWYMRVEANKAAIKAVIVNKVGDCAFLIASGLVYFNFKTLNIVTFLSFLSNYSDLNFLVLELPFQTLLNSWTFVALFFLIAVMGKSAQIGLHTWLPDAMEGPTPVSALIHAATMVTAGIFLVIRLNLIFELAPVVLQLMIVIGASTALFAASVALVQNDIKKIIAYSTCSQLGYMLAACGLSKYGLAFFHLFTHGFFKALLFLCAGGILHGMHDDQDLRRMGALGSRTSFLYVILLIGSLALTGFPFLSGFYSKELIILSTIYDIVPFWGFLFYAFLVVAAIMTILYSYRLFYLAFLAKRVSSINLSFHSSGFFVNIALTLLSVGALFVGFVFQDYFINFNNEFELFYFFTDDLVPYFIKILLLFLLVGNFVLFFSFKLVSYLFTVVYWYTYFFIKNMRTFVWFFSKKVYFDKIYNHYFLNSLFLWCYKTFYLLDIYFFEIFGPRGVVYLLLRSARYISFYQHGSIFFYLITTFLFGSMLCCIIYFF